MGFIQGFIHRELLEVPVTLLTASIVLLAVFLGRSSAAETAPTPTTIPSSNVYIVHLVGSLPPVTTYRGGINGYAPTAPTGATGLLGFPRRQRLHPAAAAVRQYASFLRQKQLEVIAAVNLTRMDILYSYQYAMNGFAAKVRHPGIFAGLQQHPLVAAVHPMTVVSPSLTGSPSFLQLPQTLWQASGGPNYAGKGVVVGIIDTGIWPENPFFNDMGVRGSTVPSYWTGSCVNSPDFPPTACNSKLIGAKYFAKGAMATGALDLTSDWLSPRDAAGHGTWCASAVAGAANVEVIKNGSDVGPTSGIAPGARIAMYKVFWTTPSLAGQATNADLIAAVNEAIMDGVDVLSCSWGAPSSAKSLHSFDYIFMNAAQAGIFTAMAAGNDGPPPDATQFTSLSNVAPFYLTVGASTIDRKYVATFTFGASSISVPALVPMPPSPTAPLVAAAACALPTVDPNSASLCSNNTLDTVRCVGKIIVCNRGVVFFSEKISNVKKAGGVGIVVVNVAGGKTSILGFSDSFPAAHLTIDQGAALQQYMASQPVPVGSISGWFQQPADNAPQVASFSSRGPVISLADRSSRTGGLTNSILKPDVLGPGVNLWGAAPADSLSSPVPQFAMLSGTSMATPHLAGIAAMIVAQNPSWTPAMVRSAIMTTAYQTQMNGQPITNDDGSPADPWSTGSGHVNTAKVLDPGLVYDANFIDYVNYMYDRFPVQARVLFPGVKYHGVDPSNLNYPNILVSNLRLPVYTVTRTVTSVLNQPATFTASIVQPNNAHVTVSPQTLTLQPGQSMSYSVTIMVTLRSDYFGWGGITWSDQQGHNVRSVLGVQAPYS